MGWIFRNIYSPWRCPRITVLPMSFMSQCLHGLYANEDSKHDLTKNKLLTAAVNMLIWLFDQVCFLMGHYKMLPTFDQWLGCWWPKDETSETDQAMTWGLYVLFINIPLLGIELIIAWTELEWDDDMIISGFMLATARQTTQTSGTSLHIKSALTSFSLLYA